MKKHKQPTKTGKAMGSIGTKMHKPSAKAFAKDMEGLEGEYRAKAKRNKRLEGKPL